LKNIFGKFCIGKWRILFCLILVYLSLFCQN